MWLFSKRLIQSLEMRFRHCLIFDSWQAERFLPLAAYQGAHPPSRYLLPIINIIGFYGTDF